MLVRRPPGRVGWGLEENREWWCSGVGGGSKWGGEGVKINADHLCEEE